MKYKLIKKCEVSASHYLDLSYDSQYRNVHGHNWVISIQVEGDMLRPEGFLIDVEEIESFIKQLDCKHINDVIQTNATAENIAVWVAGGIQSIIDEYWGGGHGKKPAVTEIKVQELEGQTIHYVP